MPSGCLRRRRGWLGRDDILAGRRKAGQGVVHFVIMPIAKHGVVTKRLWSNSEAAMFLSVSRSTARWGAGAGTGCAGSRAGSGVGATL
jgi:hypothetical protein